MMYNGNQFWGMDMLWWFIWIILMIWIFALPYDIPFQRKPKNSSLDILQKRFASGQITKEQFVESRELLLRDIIG